MEEGESNPNLHGYCSVYSETSVTPGFMIQRRSSVRLLAPQNDELPGEQDKKPRGLPSS